MSNIFKLPALWINAEGVSPPAAWVSADQRFKWYGTFNPNSPADQEINYTGIATDIPSQVTLRVIVGASIYGDVVRLTLTSNGIPDQRNVTLNATQDIVFNIPSGTTTLKLQVGTSYKPAYLYSTDVSVEGIAFASAPCEELGRVTRAYMSAYDRTKVHSFRLFASERRCFVANANGAIPRSRTVVKAVWQTNQTGTIAMSSPAITVDGRESTVLVDSGLAGPATIKCTLTLDNGERYIQLFSGSVLAQPYYTGDTYTNGVQSVTVEA